MTDTDWQELANDVIDIVKVPYVKRIAELERQLADIKSPYGDALLTATKRETELLDLRARLIRVGCLNPDATDDVTGRRPSSYRASACGATDDDTTVEKVARAIRPSAWREAPEDRHSLVRVLRDADQEDALNTARAAIAALRGDSDV